MMLQLSMLATIPLEYLLENQEKKDCLWSGINASMIKEKNRVIIRMIKKNWFRR